MTDQDRIVELMEQHGVKNKSLADDLLGLYIEIAGEKLIEIERAKAGIYRTILTNKLVKPEYMKAIYELMQQSEEKLQ